MIPESQVTRFEGSNIPKGARSLVFNDRVYRFLVGRSHVQVWAPDGTKYLVDMNGLHGSDVLHPDPYNEYHFETTPFHIRRFIERGFRAATEPV